MATTEFQVTGTNNDALFTMKIHRGEGMALLAMNWKNGKPPRDFVGFAIEYKEPNGDKFFPLKNRLSFPGVNGQVQPNALSTRLSPIQKFRWVHFPRNAELKGDFTYKVTPVFMNANGELSYGESDRARIQLRRETFPGQLNVTFTRGFISSQAFVDRYLSAGPVNKLLPAKSELGLTFKPTHPKTKEALDWMGFEARNAILEVLDDAINDATAKVRVIAYDLSERGIVEKLEKLGNRLHIIIDDDGAHGKAGSGENQAETRLKAKGAKVKRQHMGKLQHNKTIVVDGQTSKLAVCGSTNYTWRGFFVQSNNAMIFRGAGPVKIFMDAFDHYWNNDLPGDFSQTASARFSALQLNGIDAQIAFTPLSSANSQLALIGEDMKTTQSSLFFSLAFLYQTKGPIRDAVLKLSKDNKRFVYGISDKQVGGLDFQKPNGKVVQVSPAALSKGVPEPFKSEPSGGAGIRMHHKFVVIDFDKPEARVYLGSYNFSGAADGSNGENLILVKDRRIATAYMIEAVRMFDHYHFRLSDSKAKGKKKKTKLQLAKAPQKAIDKPWWHEDYTDARKIMDRELFA